MHRAFIPVAAVVVAFATGSCVSSPSSPSSPFVHDIHGMPAHLPSDDLTQLNRLIAQRADIKKPLSVVRLDGPNHAECTGGHAFESFAPITVFKAYKKNGRWFIDAKSVFQTNAIVTS